MSSQRAIARQSPQTQCTGAVELRRSINDWLMAGASGDPFNAYLFACVIAARSSENDDALHKSLGLTEAMFESLLQTYFPVACKSWDRDSSFREYACNQVSSSCFPIHAPSVPSGEAMRFGESSLSGKPTFPEPHGLDEEVEDLRKLLLESRANRGPEELWLAAVIARTALRPNHLWEDFGVTNRGEISRMMQHHFPPLAEKKAPAHQLFAIFINNVPFTADENNIAESRVLKNLDLLLEAFRIQHVIRAEKLKVLSLG